MKQALSQREPFQTGQAGVIGQDSLQPSPLTKANGAQGTPGDALSLAISYPVEKSDGILEMLCRFLKLAAGSVKTSQIAQGLRLAGCILRGDEGLVSLLQGLSCL